MSLSTLFKSYQDGGISYELLLIITAADDIFCEYFSEKIRLDISCESSAKADDSHEISSLTFSEKIVK